MCICASSSSPYLGLFSSFLVTRSVFPGPCVALPMDCFADKQSIREGRRCGHFCQPYVWSLGSVCVLVFTLGTQVVRSWMKEIGVHHRQRGQVTKKGTPSPLGIYCLNIDDIVMVYHHICLIDMKAPAPPLVDEQRSLARATTTFAKMS